MVRKIKPTKEERKAASPRPDAPDEFISTTQRVFDWMTANSKVVLGILAVALVAGILYGSANAYGDHVSGKASKMLGEVIEIQNARVDISGTAPADGSERVFASEEEKLQALREAALRLIDAHPGHEAGNAGRLYLGRACLDSGDADCAVEAYKGYLDHASKSDPLRTIALLGLGAAMEQKGDQDQAFDAYRQIADGRSTFLKDMGLLQAGRVLTAKGDTEKAKSYLERLESDFPESPLKSEAAALLGGAQ